MTATNHRWISFSLRTLFVVMTLLACCIGWGFWTWRTATSDRDYLPFVAGSILIGGNLVVTFLTRTAMRLRR